MLKNSLRKVKLFATIKTGCKCRKYSQTFAAQWDILYKLISSWSKTQACTKMGRSIFGFMLLHRYAVVFVVLGSIWNIISWGRPRGRSQVRDFQVNSRRRFEFRHHLTIMSLIQSYFVHLRKSARIRPVYPLWLLNTHIYFFPVELLSPSTPASVSLFSNAQS